jgi:membrane protein DedA with SNARE-associated domain
VTGWWETAAATVTDIEAYILEFAASVWLYPGVLAVSFIDAIFPVVPSESVVIASSTAWAQTGNGLLEFSNPMLPLIFVSAAVGAWCGDQVTYLIGSKINVRKLRIFRTGRGLATLDWAEHALEHRGTSFIIAARFIPMGRVTVNLTAGALGYPRRRFMGVDGIAVIIWAAWGVALGTFAGSLFHNNLLLSIVAGVVGGVLLGMLVDKIMERIGLAPPDMPDLAAEIEHRTDDEPHGH